MVWARNNQDENSSRSPGTNSCGSPAQNLRSYTVLGHEANYVHNGMAPAHMEAQTPKTPTTNTPKSKARTNFSDSQMNILSERFSMQRYLSPSEMRSMAELTGLTYKQVSGWFEVDCKVEIPNAVDIEIFFLLEGEDLVSEPQDETKAGTEEHWHRLDTRVRHTPQPSIAHPGSSSQQLCTLYSEAVLNFASLSCQCFL